MFRDLIVEVKSRKKRNKDIDNYENRRKKAIFLIGGEKLFMTTPIMYITK